MNKFNKIFTCICAPVFAITFAFSLAAITLSLTHNTEPAPSETENAVVSKISISDSATLLTDYYKNYTASLGEETFLTTTMSGLLLWESSMGRPYKLVNQEYIKPGMVYSNTKGYFDNDNLQSHSIMLYDTALTHYMSYSFINNFSEEKTYQQWEKSSFAKPSKNSLQSIFLSIFDISSDQEFSINPISTILEGKTYKNGDYSIMIVQKQSYSRNGFIDLYFDKNNSLIKIEFYENSQIDITSGTITFSFESFDINIPDVNDGWTKW